MKKKEFLKNTGWKIVKEEEIPSKVVIPKNIMKKNIRRLKK